MFCLVSEIFGFEKAGWRPFPRPDLYLPYLLTDFDFLKLKMLAIKYKVGLPLKPILARRSNRGCYKIKAISRPELYVLYLLTDFNFFKLKMLAIKNKVWLPKTILSLEFK